MKNSTFSSDCFCEATTTRPDELDLRTGEQQRWSFSSYQKIRHGRANYGLKPDLSRSTATGLHYRLQTLASECQQSKSVLYVTARRSIHLTLYSMSRTFETTEELSYLAKYGKTHTHTHKFKQIMFFPNRKCWISLFGASCTHHRENLNTLCGKTSLGRKNLKHSEVN